MVIHGPWHSALGGSTMKCGGIAGII